MHHFSVLGGLMRVGLSTSPDRCLWLACHERQAGFEAEDVVFADAGEKTAIFVVCLRDRVAMLKLVQILL